MLSPSADLLRASRARFLNNACALRRVGGLYGEGPCIVSEAWSTVVPCCCFREGVARVLLPPSAVACLHVLCAYWILFMNAS